MRFFSFFKRKTSSQIAKDRLKILVISKYMKIDAASMEVQIAKTGNSVRNGKKMPVLYANIPILDLRS